jgi:hypothetical protein
MNVMKAISPSLKLHVPDNGWKIEARVRAVAGTLVLAGVALTFWVSPWWLLLPAFVGVNLLQSAFTEYCLMSNLLAMVFGIDR